MLKKTNGRRKTGRTILSVFLSLLLMMSLLTFASADDPVTQAWIGDGTPDEHDVRIIGMVEIPGYFTLAGLIEAAEEYTKTLDYFWMNNSGSTDTDTFTGVYVEELLTEIMTLSDRAKGLIVTASDNWSIAFNLNDEATGAFWTDIEGNKMILAWNGTQSRTNRDIVDFSLPRIVVGQKDENDINRQYWANDVAEIRVTAFGDLRGFDWAAPAIEALVEMKVVNGVSEYSFSPGTSFTRAHCVTLLAGIMNPDKIPATNVDIVFDDVDYESWYGVHVEWAVEQGYVRGFDDGTFRPNDPISAEHLGLLMNNVGLLEMPDGVNTTAQRSAFRAEAVVAAYALYLQLEG